MTRLLFAIPGDLSTRTGGYEYDRRILAAAPALGLETEPLALPGAFPHPTARDVEEALARIQGARQAGDVLLIDGLAAGALPDTALGAIDMPFIALCHHPLCLETGLSSQQAAFLRETETRVLSRAARVIVTSAHTGALLQRDFSVPAEKIAVAPPGTAPTARARGTGRPCRLLAVGALIPRKGFDVAIEALSGLQSLDWRLDIVGSRSPSPATAGALDRLICARGLSDRVRLLGEQSADALDALLDRADIFVSSSHYEGYGMALAEALKRGLPIVMTASGAAADTVPDAAALKIPAGETAAFRAALRAVMTDDALRGALADAAWRAGQVLPGWEEAARIVVETARAVGLSS